MRILQLCKKFPFPPKDGESFAVTNLSSSLKELGTSIDLLAFNTSKHYVSLEELPTSFDYYENIHTVEIDNRIRLIDAIANLFSSKSYHIDRFDNLEFKEKLKSILQKKTYDIVFLETIYMASYMDIIRANSKAKVVMRAHNVEYEIWNRTAQESHLIKKYYLLYLATKLKTFESRIINSFDLFITLTDRDMKHFGLLGLRNKSCILPIGVRVDAENKYNARISDNIKVGFIGSLDWLPNLNGLKWFMAEVWPVLISKYNNLSLRVAGRNMPESWKNRDDDGIEYCGEVDSASEFTLSNDIMIVPLFSGSGMRVKILEGMSLGVPLVSTDIGIEGIHATDKVHYLKANNKEEFISQMQSVIEYRVSLEEMSQRAHSFVNEYFDSRLNAKRLLEIMTDLTD